MGDDALAIQKVTSKLADDGQQIILVMHSYGGIPGTESAKGLSWEIRQANGEPGGIIALVYVSAYLIKEGMSVMSVAGDAEWPAFLTKQVCFLPTLSDVSKLTATGRPNSLRQTYRYRKVLPWLPERRICNSMGRKIGATI
jgi:hypothetical protein